MVRIARAGLLLDFLLCVVPVANVRPMRELPLTDRPLRQAALHVLLLLACLALVVTARAFAAGSDRPSSPSPGVSVAGGQGQHVVLRATPATPFSVRVADAAGRPRPG